MLWYLFVVSRWILLFSGKGEICFLHAVAVDGLEVVLHGDDGVAGLAPFCLATGAFCEVGMITGVIVGYEHERGGTVLLVAQAVVVHGAVATAVSERQHGHLANLLADLQHFVGLQVPSMPPLY